MSPMRRLRRATGGTIVVLALLAAAGCAAPGGGGSGGGGAAPSGASIDKGTPNVARHDAPSFAVYANYFALLKTMSPVPNWTGYPDFGTGPGIQGTPDELAALKGFRSQLR